MLRSKVVLLVAMAACVVLSGCHPREIATIPASADCFNTPKGSSSARLARSPLPAGFFGEGSEPFDGEICFEGNPDNVLDTCVRRASEMRFDDNGQASTRIELTDLDLVSCEPIRVKIGDRETVWDVHNTVSKVKPSAGKMQVTRKDENGGTFEAEISVLSRMTFRPRDSDLEVRVFDMGEMDMPAQRLATTKPVPWKHTTELEVRYDEERDFSASNNFLPGLQIVNGVDRQIELEHRGETWGHMTTLVAELPPSP